MTAHFNKNKCNTSHCRKNRGHHRRFCYSCVKKKYAEKYPIKNAYYVLRQNARRRKKTFTISLAEFSQFCIKTKILLGRGIQKDSYSIDRIDEFRGYEPDNIQVLTNSDNVKKYNKQVRYDWEHRHGFVVKNIEQETTTPF